MKRLTFALVTVAGFCAAQQSPEVLPSPFTLQTEVGAQVRQTDGEKTFGFQRYTAIPHGFLLRQFDFNVLKEGNPLRFTFRSLDLGQRDQVFGARLENIGKLTLDFKYSGSQR